MSNKQYFFGIIQTNNCTLLSVKIIFFGEISCVFQLIYLFLIQSCVDLVVEKAMGNFTHSLSLF